MENNIYDYIIIGAGYGGLSAAALLAREGYKTLLLESHIAIGGCASFYKRKGILFDVGATTFSGVLPHQPLGRLFKELDIQPNLKKVDPGMIIKLGEKEIFRYADKITWIAENERVFHLPGLTEFWKELYSLEQKSWDLTSSNYMLPPQNLSDLLKLAKLSNIKALPLATKLFQPISKMLAKYNLHQSTEFSRFLREQLLITSQNDIEDTPILPAALGLTYPSETYYPYGGMHMPGELIKNKYLEYDGILKFKAKVEQIEKTDFGYKLTTAKGEQFNTRGVVSNIPVWNLTNITSGNLQKYFNEISNKFTFSWGAITLNFAVKSDVSLPSLYYQIHIEDKIPFVNSDAFFVSFSAEDDRERSPEGVRAVTISLHTKVENWLDLEKTEYERRKNIVTNGIIKEFDRAFPQYSGEEKSFLMTGTPKTFEFFTGRHNGFVGGIPHSVKQNLLSMPSNKTPFNHFYLTGDTAFPGQGTPAVVLGALNTIKRIISN
ncbi:MAG: C-3',4' desaturase CrtD [Melioribacteraceae bacterium]|nr:MAG: C-3',4' desaturase CrtD [Melioribacteraceae bacterium]